MNKKEKWAHIETCLNKLDGSMQQNREICKFIGFDNKVTDYGDGVCDMLVDSLGLLVGDVESISWYVFENDFGRCGLTASSSGSKKMKKIDSIKKLRKLIEA